MEEKDLKRKINKNLSVDTFNYRKDCIMINKLDEYIPELIDIQNSMYLRTSLLILTKHNIAIVNKKSLSIDKEKTDALQDLLTATAKNLEQIHEIIFPTSKREKEVSHSWDNVDILDLMDIDEEVKKYTDSPNLDNMTLEETLKLIEEHNPSFVKAKREELAAQNSDPDLSQPT